MTDQACTIVLLAPLSGALLPLSETPDPVFAQKMAGDGVALMPSSDVLRAPCDGTVTHLHPSVHALTVTGPEGLQVLLHIGIETVGLQGKGFEALVAVGDRVRAGDALVRFDLAHVRREARSPLTLMLVANGELVAEYRPAVGEVTAGSSPALEVRLEQCGREIPRKDLPEPLPPDGRRRALPAVKRLFEALPAIVSRSLFARKGNTPAQDATPGSAREDGRPVADGGMVESPPVLIRNPLGLHARPSATLANRAKTFRSDIILRKDGREANAKSVVSIMGLDIKELDRVVVRAGGPDAAQALDALVALLESGLGDDLHAPAPFSQEEKNVPPRSSEDASILYGVPASPGIRAGTLFRLRRNGVEVPERGGSIEDEKKSLETALDAAGTELELLRKRLREKGDAGRAAIFAAHAELLDDPELLRAVRKNIAAGQSAAHAWQQAVTAQADVLARMDNTLLANRAVDIRDVGDRVLKLLGGRASSRLEPPPDAILVVGELTPSETAELDPGSIGGICATSGSASSHTAILARAMGIPAIAAIEPRILEIADGTPAILDGDSGTLRLNPDETEKRRVLLVQEEISARRERELRDAAGPALTLDGHRVLVAGTIGGLDDALELERQGGEGVGLLRSEFLFLRRFEPPSEKEQADAYRNIAAVIGPEKNFVVRTLDVGGDKGLAYLPLPPEGNPFLGLRGIRLSLIHTDLFTAQARAILSAASLARLHIMFPMVATVEELRAAKDVVEREKKALGVTAPVAVGIMVEVPSAALLAESLAVEADFFSLGTNDLTQYTLAIDRGNASLASMADALHPAVLRLIAATVAGAHKFGKWVGVCGGAACDHAAVPLLVGLGVDELSVNPQAVPAVKSRIRGLNREQCAILAADALTMQTASDVREYVRLFLEE